ncbi:hypothetical protein IWW48_000882 [Coemansia sp. RSA 1200]|nr:hypothetical protein IWW48_000882 [Coemansia sp. RSA 1200]
MYIPASSSAASPFVQRPPASAAPSTCTSAVTVENHNCYRSPAFSLKLQSGGRNVVFGQKKKQPLPAYIPPAVVRKDSGEIVRPCLRKRSATTSDLPALQVSSPASPCSSSADCSSPSPDMRTPRFVHFGADLECVRWFLKAQSPRSACRDAVPDYFSASEDELSRRATPSAASVSSAASSKPETVRLTSVRRPAPSFTLFEESPVVIERVELADNRRSSASLRGSVKVHNIAFEKCVSVRYSFDQWRTAEETNATYSRTLLDSQGSTRPGVDRFAFSIALPPSLLAAPLPATVALCARYSVAGAEYWDNNSGSNYIFKISQPAVPAIVDDDADYDGITTINNSSRSNATSYDVMSAGGITERSAAADLCAPRRISFGNSAKAAFSSSLSSSSSSPNLQLHSFQAPSAADTRRYMAQSAALFGLSSRHQRQQTPANNAPSPSVTPLLPEGCSKLSAGHDDTFADDRNGNYRRRASLPSFSSSPRMQQQQQQQKQVQQKQLEPLCCSSGHELPLYQEVAWCEGEGASLSYATSSATTSLSPDIVTSPSSPSSPSSYSSARFADSMAVEYLSSSNNSTPTSSPQLSPSSPLASEDPECFVSISSTASFASLPTSMMRTGSPLGGHVVFDSDSPMRAGSPLVWSHSNAATSLLQC